ncbi:MAG: purine-nucleoside phosphorylase [candidate division WOR-3 bacterium]
MYSRIEEAVDYIRSRCPQRPLIGLILGSGLGAYADSFEDRTVIPFSAIPHFPTPAVSGHPGNLVFGYHVGDFPVVALQGRVHLYEGYSAAEVAYPARILGCLGIKQLVVTNAAGAVNSDFRPGDLMLIIDHINLMGANPLIGPNLESLGPRFPDMSEAYDRDLRSIALDVAQEKGIKLWEGVYVGLCGPSYETPAEIRMCRTLGADAVGMSTIPEVIVARHMGIPVLGISCITNMAAGITDQKLTHQEVIRGIERIKGKLFLLLQAIIPRMAKISE